MSDLLNPPEDTIQLAEWYTEHHETIERVTAAWRASKSRLLSFVKAKGPLRTPAGRVTIAPNGYDWSDEAVQQVAERYPELITDATVTVRLSAGQDGAAMARAREVVRMVMEFDETAEVDWDTALDKRLANEFIREGGECGEFLGALRQPRGKLAVRT